METVVGMCCMRADSIVNKNKGKYLLMKDLQAGSHRKEARCF